MSYQKNSRVYNLWMLKRFKTLSCEIYFWWNSLLFNPCKNVVNVLQNSLKERRIIVYLSGNISQEKSPKPLKTGNRKNYRYLNEVGYLEAN